MVIGKIPNVNTNSHGKCHGNGTQKVIKEEKKKLKYYSKRDIDPFIIKNAWTSLVEIYRLRIFYFEINLRKNNF